MGAGYLLGGIACLLYAILVGYFGGIKKSPGLLRLVKMKLNKNMSDATAAIICLSSCLSSLSAKFSWCFHSLERLIQPPSNEAISALCECWEASNAFALAWFSTEAPIQTLGSGHEPTRSRTRGLTHSHHFSIRPGRFVRTMKI